MQNEENVSPACEPASTPEKPKEEKKARTLGKMLTFLTENLGTKKPTPDRITKKGKAITYHEPNKRRTLRKAQRRSRQINARKAKG